MTKHKSSCVNSYAYSKAEKKLTVYYTNYLSYDYSDVPESVYLGLIQADSKGQYLNANVKGIYNYTKVTK
jgi:hypothetical protein